MFSQDMEGKKSIQADVDEILSSNSSAILHRVYADLYRKFYNGNKNDSPALRKHRNKKFLLDMPVLEEERGYGRFGRTDG